MPASGPAVFCCIGCRLAAAAAGRGGGDGLLEARLLLAAVLAMGVMTFSLTLYDQSTFAGEPDAALIALRNLGRMALVLLSAPVFLLLGVPLLRGAWLDARAGRVRMDGLIVLATTAAYALSIHATWTEKGEVYFDTATMVLVLVTFGRRLEARARVHGRDAAETLAECLPPSACRVHDGAPDEEVDPESLTPGNVVRIAPGAAVPADVQILEGTSEATQSHVTGEELPRDVRAGDELPAGAINGSGALLARVVRAAEDGAIGRIRALLEEPLPPTAWFRATDRLAGWLAALAIVLATAGGIRSGMLHGAGAACETALSVLLVACPCALGLAMPLAYRAIRANLARKGVLVREARALEAAAGIDVALLDKTGTLTDPRAARLAPAAGARAHHERMAALVGHSGHALAFAVAQPTTTPTDVRLVPGAGVIGEVDGTPGRAGSPEWMDRLGMTWDDDMDDVRERLADKGVTVVAYAESGRVRAVSAVQHTFRPAARDAIAALREHGTDIEIVSGDHERAVLRAAEALGVRARGALDPAAKLARVQELQAQGKRVLVAGDGINDAPALRAADVGVALGCGTAAARSQADVEVLGDDLCGVSRLLGGARQLRSVVRSNLFWAVAYNMVALGFATAGLLHPLLAVAAMIISSLTVSARSYALLDAPIDAPVDAPRPPGVAATGAGEDAA